MILLNHKVTNLSKLVCTLLYLILIMPIEFYDSLSAIADNQSEIRQIRLERKCLWIKSLCPFISPVNITKSCETNLRISFLSAMVLNSKAKTVQ